ncbi:MULTISPECIES: TetR/AcrR family transcriptional regulator [Lentzea]|uniref:Transcriptional regulator, TetR family n=1 Tax=Lentzea albida TaxID=65499 RepID=A0A1H9IMI3_9PSEU|nr:MULTISPECIES: TetR/AcrR family transcriptional regulator [Lentzea]USX50821.1 TetR/AcrR family transcriptional regulator [Lentzea sp. HUAS12]SEQ75717.1 transcriptional regulator, TetR family [Lentzea albida]
MRADARENRARVLTVARELFAERGLDVPMAAIARRAGVGVATLYRRFPTKESLVVEAFTEQFAHCQAVIDDAMQDPDAWRGFCTVIEQVCLLQVRDRGFTAAFVASFPELHSEVRDRTWTSFSALVQRAKDSGQLRADFSPHDLMLVLLANNGLSGAPVEAAVAASRRLVAYLLESFRTGTDALPPPVPLSLDLVLN